MEFVVRFFMAYGIILGIFKARAWWEHRELISTSEGAKRWYDQQKTKELIKVRRRQAITAWDAIFPLYFKAVQSPKDKATVQQLEERFTIIRHGSDYPDPEKLVEILGALVETRIYTGRLPILDQAQLRSEMLCDTEGMELSFTPFIMQPADVQSEETRQPLLPA